MGGTPAAIVLRRGPYVIAAGLDESVPDAASTVLHGRFIDLFDAELPVLTAVTLSPGKRSLLFDLDRIESAKPAIAAAASRASDEEVNSDTLRFRAEGIADTQSVVRIASREEPTAVMIAGEKANATQYDFSGGAIRLRFANSVDGVPIEIKFAHSGESKSK